MNKLAACLIVAALVSPAFAEEAKPPTKTETTKKVEVKKHLAKKAKKTKSPVQSSVSSIHNPDYPWMLPS